MLSNDTLVLQGYFEEPPNRCWKVVRMVAVAFILGIITGLIVYPYVMPWLGKLLRIFF